MGFLNALAIWNENDSECSFPSDKKVILTGSEKKVKENKDEVETAWVARAHVCPGGTWSEQLAHETT